MVVSAYTLLDHPGQQRERLEMVTDLWRMTSDVLVSFSVGVCVCVYESLLLCFCECIHVCIHLVQFESMYIHCLHTHRYLDIVGTNEWLTDTCYACTGSGGKWHISWLLTD